MSGDLILDRDFFISSLTKMAQLSEERRDYWTSLDSDIGDGDHGINLSIGFRGIMSDLDNVVANTDDISGLLKKAGMILLSKVGGASGPLYGSFFMKMGNDVTGQTTVSFSEFLKMIENGIDAIQLRGKAELGDKTMLDAFLPGYSVLEAYQEGDNQKETFEHFINAMKQGSDNTIPLVAKKGRAMRLGERAIGHRDPGSESSWELMNVFNEELQNKE